MKFYKLSCALVLMSIPLMAIAKNKTNYPLEQVISIFSNKEYGNSFSLSKNKYLSVKGVKWEYISKESELPRFDFSGTLNLIRLKDVEISIIGNNDIITYINIHSNRPSKDTFKILRENLKTYKISKLNCEKSSGYSYFYLAEKENNIPIYIEVEVNLTEEPYMSPLYTIFEFYQYKRPEWGC